MKCAKKALPLIVIFLLILFPSSVFAHGGKTDANGGHTDSSTGEYHYHHGYPAHQHYDIDGDGRKDCPYDFDDKTDHSFNNSSGSGSSGGSSGTGSGSSDKNKPSSSVSPTKLQNSKTPKSSRSNKSATIHYVIAAISIPSFIVLLIIFWLEKNENEWWSRIQNKNGCLTNLLFTLLLFGSAPVGVPVYLGYSLVFRPIRYACRAIHKRYKQQQIMAAEQNLRRFNIPDTARCNLSKSEKLCCYLWIQVFDFCKRTGLRTHFKDDIAYWTALFYVATKTIRKQDLVNEIYAHFTDVLTLLIENNYFPQDPEATCNQGKELYKSFAISLNASNIDPRTPKGVASLWLWLYGRAYMPYKTSPFEVAVKRTIEYTRMLYGTQNTTKTESPISSSDKYSISDDENSYLP